MSVDVAIIGGGLVGLAAAFEARRHGLSVRVIEAARCGRHASSASAGGVRSLNRHPAEIPLARAALGVWRGLAARLGDDVGFVPSGQMRLAEDAPGMAALEARAQATADAGWTHERLLTSAELRARLPASAPHVQGALVVEDDGLAYPLATLHAYRRACRAAGVTITENCRVTGISRAGPDALALDTAQGEIRARHVVNCAGAWGGALATGDNVPMRIAALQMIVTAPVAHFVTPVVGAHGRKLSLKQTSAGAVVIGGAFEGHLHDESDSRTARGDLDPARIGASLGNACAIFPHLATARILRAWTGLEGMTADGLPVLGPSNRIAGLFHAFGFSAHGFALAPLVGRMIADHLNGASNSAEMAPFSPARFATDQPRQKELSDA
ncbi:NAD(P)/FAD-dependent oxidoreductase [Roseovarius sp. D22-M7]|uniref:NAD(P)/FAD-dependent oxidoreductase n=1 Tax=Roseovarius sp. D22-M7 TaxID=3127116 RepID=UPI00300FF2EB